MFKKSLVGIFIVILTISLLFSGKNIALADGDFSINSAQSSSQLSGWEASKAYDNNVGSCWSSNTHTSSSYTEWLSFSWSGITPTNYVKLLPRYNVNNALCFPVNFNIYYNNGTQWVLIDTYTNYPTPGRGGEYIILALKGNYSANGIKIEATTLGNDGSGNYAFQLAEVIAGYNAGFNSLRYGGNNKAVLPSKIQISGVGANSFNPNKLATWFHDDRGVVIAPAAGTYRNIYSPWVIPYGGSTYRVYFHGYDGISAPAYDRIYTTATTNDFATFDTHALQIDHGVFENVGNESVWIDGSTWHMAYTTMMTGAPHNNKPGYATSTNGVSWTPNAGNASNMINITGYPNWNNIDMNGSNVLYKSGSTWYMYFDDLNDGQAFPYTYYATGTDGINFAYQGVATNGGRVMSDFKAFTYNSTEYYFLLYHFNTQHIFQTLSTSKSSLGTPAVLLSNFGIEDKYIVNACLVQDNNKVQGILYGAGPVATCDQNSIYARWLQKKIVFENQYVTWNVQRGYGPKIGRLALSTGNKVETGYIKIYDTDGTTLLYTSPQVTMCEGDLWNYSGL